MRTALLVLVLPFLGASVGCDKKPADGVVPTASAAPAASPIGEVKGKRVDVVAGAEGFKPSEIAISKGQETTLVFTRTTDDTCATAVVFPELKIKQDLPLNKPVAIVMPSGEAKTYGFQCGMGMYKSKVVVQ